MNLKTFGKKVGKGIAKNLPRILVCGSIAGMVTSVVFAVKATPKAMILLDEKKQELGTEKLDVKTNVKTAAPAYIPTAISMVASAGCMIGAMNENDRRNAALAAAYSLSESALKQYQEKVVETIGEEKEKELRQTITLDKMAKQPEETPVIVPAARDASYDQLVECYESFSGRYFKTTVNALDRAMNGLNKQLLSDFRVTQNDLFDYLGLEHTKNGDLLGWDTDSTLTIETFYSSKLDEDGMPCMVLDYSTPPKWLGY